MQVLKLQRQFDKIHYVNVEECEKIASSLGAKFRNREFIENGY